MGSRRASTVVRRAVLVSVLRTRIVLYRVTDPPVSCREDEFLILVTYHKLLLPGKISLHVPLLLGLVMWIETPLTNLS